MAYNTKNILRSGDASPIPIPQFYNPTEDAFNPLTGANLGGGRYGADGVMWGKTAGGVYIPVQVNANGEVLTQLSGRNVEKVKLIDSLALTDTIQYWMNIDLKKYKQFSLIMNSSLDADVRITINYDSTYPTYVWDTSNQKWVLASVLVYPMDLNNSRIIINDRFPWLSRYSLDKLQMYYKAMTVPTQGSLVITLVGVIN